jgi:hypothetical protein
VTEAVAYLVQERQGAVLLRQIAELGDRANATTHGVDGLERDDLRRFLRILLELGLEIREIVVLPDHALRARVAHALDHARVVHLIGEINAAGKFGAERG